MIVNSKRLVLPPKLYNLTYKAPEISVLYTEQALFFSPFFGLQFYCIKTISKNKAAS